MCSRSKETVSSLSHSAMERGGAASPTSSRGTVQGSFSTAGPGTVPLWPVQSEGQSNATQARTGRNGKTRRMENGRMGSLRVQGQPDGSFYQGNAAGMWRPRKKRSRPLGMRRKQRKAPKNEKGN